MLNRFYAICNCCSCCCGAMQAQRNGTPMIASSGYVAQMDEGACASCGECADVCQFAAISIDGVALIDAAACMGCGVCVAHCPQEAIALVREPGKGEPLEIQPLIAYVAKLIEASSVWME
ncbi:MAG: 4Fe-4S binding protein [Anaerolineae bacterium]|nr:4Fe-4S binding protein [Anaerolineae bacterium]